MNNKENLISIRIIGLILLLSIFLQIILGAWVRLTGSGMSCPDWPLCYGYIFPTPNKIANIPNVEYSYFQIFLEWIHRANAALVIGPICLIFSLYLIIKKNLNHFLEQNTFIANRFIKVTTILSGFFTMSAAALGAFTSKYGASLSCNNWPGCTDSFFPNFSDMFQVIHFSHRVIAMLLVFVLISLFVALKKYFNTISKNIKLILLGMFLIITFQVIIGALLIYMEVPIWMGIFHQSIGLLLFTLIVLLYSHIELKRR